MKKKQLKGMTLMEIIVSMAVYGVLALLMVEIMSVVNAEMRTTNQLNKRLAYEARFADNRMTSDTMDAEFGSALTGTGRTMTITYGTGGAGGSISSAATEYTARYRNPNTADDKTTQTNYKYMVFENSVTPPAKLTLRLQVDPSFPYPINTITATGYGDFTLGADGWYTNPNIDYPPSTAANGIINVSVTIFADMTSLTGNVSKPIYQSDGTTLIANSDDYPVKTFTLSHLAWVKDATDTLTNIKARLDYSMLATGEVKLVHEVNAT